MMNPNTRPSNKDVDDLIKDITYTRLPSGTSIVCEITLLNLHTEHGIAKVADFENYDEEVGKKMALQKARDKVFELVTFNLHTKMLFQDIQNQHEALTAVHPKVPQLLE